MADRTTTPAAQIYHAYEQVEGQLSTALERLVATNGFADLLATTATTGLAIARLANDRVDQVVRATRLAGRRDVVDLARQLARTEDKLERLLQEVERLQAQLDRQPDEKPDRQPDEQPDEKADRQADQVSRNGSTGRTRTRAGAGGRRPT